MVNTITREEYTKNLPSEESAKKEERMTRKAHGICPRGTVRVLERKGSALYLEHHGPDLYNLLKEKKGILCPFLLARCILETLQALHQAGIFHGDVKPTNVCERGAEFPNGWKYVLIDFGLSVDDLGKFPLSHKSFSGYPYRPCFYHPSTEVWIASLRTQISELAAREIESRCAPQEFRLDEELLCRPETQGYCDLYAAAVTVLYVMSYLLLENGEESLTPRERSLVHLCIEVMTPRASASDFPTCAYFLARLAKIETSG